MPASESRPCTKHSVARRHCSSGYPTSCWSATRTRFPQTAPRDPRDRHEPDPRDKIARYAASLGDRLGPVLAVLLDSRGSDPELEDFARNIDAERLSGATGFVAQFADRGLLRTDLDRRHASDLVCTLISPAVHLMLQEHGWNSEQ